jgi:hypothetical protein
MKLTEYGIECKRVTIRNLIKEAVLDKNKDLYYEGYLVSFVYWRTGYLFEDYLNLGPLNKSL